MASTLQTIIGGSAAPYVTAVAVIAGRSIDNFGDADNATGTNIDLSIQGQIPIGWSASYRTITIYKVDLDALESKIEVGDATLQMAIGAQTTIAGYSFPGSNWTVKVFELEGTADSGATWRKRATGVDWYGAGYGPKPGFDYVTPELDAEVVSSTMFSTLGTAWPNNTAPAFVLQFDLGDSVQRAREERRDLYLLAMGTWAAPGGAGNAYLWADDAADSVRRSVAHTQVTVDYWPAVGIHSAIDGVSGRPADYTKLHDPAFAGTSNRTYLGAVEQGTISGDKKLWAVNHRTSGPRRALVIGTSRSEATSVDNQSGAGVTLKSVDVYDTASGERSVDGDYVVSRTSGTEYQVQYTDLTGTTVTLAEQTTGLTSVSFAADHIFVLSGSRILRIRAIRWSATTGVPSGATWRFSVRGDRRTTESVDTLSMVRIMPPTVRPFGNTADTSTARPLRNAFSQQLWAVGGFAYHDVNISGVTHTHLYVRNGDVGWATGTDAWVEVQNPGTDAWASARIEAVYGGADGTYPDELRLDRQLSPDEKAICTSNSVVSGGLILGDLAKQQVRLLISSAALGANQLVLASAFDGAPAGVRVYSETAGSSEHIVTAGGSSATLTVSPVLPATYPVGTYVSPLFTYDSDDDTYPNPGGMPERPYFVNGKVPVAQIEALYQGYYDCYEVRIV